MPLWPCAERIGIASVGDPMGRTIPGGLDDDSVGALRTGNIGGFDGQRELLRGCRIYSFPFEVTPIL